MTVVNPNLPALREKAATLPLSPGVYLMRDRDGVVVYVGKSRKLKNRVTSYFVGSGHSVKTARMVSRVADFDYILCDGEMEALTLENVLIKKYSPKYNVKLKDAKSYPYIKIGRGEYPTLTVTRQREDDKGRYFGPYQSSATAHEALDAVKRVFSLPTCRRKFPEEIGRERPCIYDQMGRCVAPCRNGVSAEEYRALVKCAGWVLEGNVADTERELTAAMTSAAEREEYEIAAKYRDRIAALHRLSDRQKVVSDASVSRDVFALFENDLCGVFAVLNVRAGKLLNKNEYLFSAGEIAEGNDVTGLLLRYYSEIGDYPREVLTDFPLDPEDCAVLSELFSREAGRSVSVRTPKRGELRDLCEMAQENARQRADRYRAETAREEGTLVSLASLLGLEVLPERIEAYDISNLGAEHITASMAVFVNGKPKRSDYRTFKIRTTDGIDDYGAMREALTRRLAHIGDGSPSLGDAPDLILVDGGVGHVHAGKTALDKTGHPEIPLFGMIKDDFHKTRAMTDGESEISFAKKQEVYVLIYKIQEEAHRIAVSSVMRAKSRTLTRSSLEKIPGIGPAKAKRLLAAFGSLRALSDADEKTLAAVRGISARDAKTVAAYFAEKKAAGRKSGKKEDPT
ncbi:MAG: excinuclease ABC subunit UvrC [Clostridia bacterium]|nr:excinuclease ABC subunit UvrC [Clostridia bacterium]